MVGDVTSRDVTQGTHRHGQHSAALQHLLQEERSQTGEKSLKTGGPGQQDEVDVLKSPSFLIRLLISCCVLLLWAQTAGAPITQISI